ncbi:uncharacterized protein ACIB01_014770 isoform 1-T1 [Guaruba guarouba]
MSHGTHRGSPSSLAGISAGQAPTHNKSAGAGRAGSSDAAGEVQVCMEQVQAQPGWLGICHSAVDINPPPPPAEHGMWYLCLLSTKEPPALPLAAITAQLSPSPGVGSGFNSGGTLGSHHRDQHPPSSQAAARSCALGIHSSLSSLHSGVRRWDELKESPALGPGGRAAGEHVPSQGHGL